MINTEDKKTAYKNALSLDLSVLGKASNTLNTLKGLFPELSGPITKSRSLMLKLKELLSEQDWKIYLPKAKPEPVAITPTVKHPTMKERKAKELKELTEKRDKEIMDKELEHLHTNMILKAEVNYPDKSKSQIERLVDLDTLEDSVELLEGLKDKSPDTQKLIDGILEVKKKLHEEESKEEVI